MFSQEGAKPHPWLQGRRCRLAELRHPHGRGFQEAPGPFVGIEEGLDLSPEIRRTATRVL